jgi:hypothetical protein
MGPSCRGTGDTKYSCGLARINGTNALDVTLQAIIGGQGASRVRAGFPRIGTLNDLTDPDHPDLLHAKILHKRIVTTSGTRYLYYWTTRGSTAQTQPDLRLRRCPMTNLASGTHEAATWSFTRPGETGDKKGWSVAWLQGYQGEDDYEYVKVIDFETDVSALGDAVNLPRRHFLMRALRTSNLFDYSNWQWFVGNEGDLDWTGGTYANRKPVFYRTNKGPHRTSWQWFGPLGRIIECIPLGDRRNPTSGAPTKHMEFYERAKPWTLPRLIWSGAVKDPDGSPNDTPYFANICPRPCRPTGRSHW